VGATTLFGVGTSAAGPDPTPGPPLPVREQNLDASGFIRVHEQGVAKSEITNSNLNVTLGNESLDVNVQNFPSTQDVQVVSGSTTPQPVENVTQLIFNVEDGESQELTFETINVTSILIITGDDEYELQAGSPLTGSNLFIAYDPSGDDETRQITFDSPVPLNRMTLVCANESENCADAVLLTGF
jgi:hypothetical protein